MTRAEHFERAEALLQEAEAAGEVTGEWKLRCAHVHALLASSTYNPPTDWGTIVIGPAPTTS